jgi:phage shock protein E
MLFMETEFVGNVYIDVRSGADFDAGHVLGAINIPLGEITADHPKLKDLERSTAIVVYCAAGGRAEMAKNKLESFSFTNVTNGINKFEVKKKYFD